MIVIKHDGTLARFTATQDQAGSAKDAIDLPIDMVEQQSKVINRIFAFVFDVLGLKTAGLRMRPAEKE